MRPRIITHLSDGALVFSCLAAVLLTACPAEEDSKKEDLGEKIEEKTDEANDGIEELGDKAEDKLDDNKDN